MLSGLDTLVKGLKCANIIAFFFSFFFFLPIRIMLPAIVVFGFSENTSMYEMYHLLYYYLNIQFVYCVCVCVCVCVFCVYFFLFVCLFVCLFFVFVCVCSWIIYISSSFMTVLWTVNISASSQNIVRYLSTIIVKKYLQIKLIMNTLIR